MKGYYATPAPFRVWGFGCSAALAAEWLRADSEPFCRLLFANTKKEKYTEPTTKMALAV